MNHLRRRPADGPVVYLAGPAQHSLCSWVAGSHVLENFENNLGEEGDNLARYRDTFESMALDLGAYMLMTEERRMGRRFTDAEREARMEKAIAFAVAHGEGYDWVSHYDDVTGGADGNWRNYERCKAAGIPRLMPVFHQGEPLDLLRAYVKDSQYVGLGFQRPIKDDLAWLDLCFAEIPEGKWVHGFAMTDYLRFPFTSADSKTWLHEVLAIMSHTSQGASALAYLTQPEIVGLVLKKYQRQWKRDRWRGTFGVAAGRGQQLDLETLIAELKESA